MNEQVARKAETRTAGLHAGHRFGEVVVGAAADEELTWFFNDAGTECTHRSRLAAALDRHRPNTAAALVNCAEAIHQARKISDRLESLTPRDAHVLRLLYTDRVWPGPLVKRFGPVVGVVEGLVRVRADYVTARMEQRTTTTSTTAWLEELVGRCCKDLAVWRRDALAACEQAVAAYEKARGDDPSVVPQEEL